jgi:hypothetical protein
MPCSFPGDCAKSLFLTCVIDEEHGGLCSCHPNEMFFDGKECLVLPGRVCRENKKCGRNSNCHNGEFCMCNEGYVLDPMQMTCLLVQRKEPTTSTVPPSSTSPPIVYETEEHLNGDEVGCSGMSRDSTDFQKCSCLIHHGEKVWSEEKATCLALVGAFCGLDEHCTELAYCEMEDRVCQCRPEARTTLNKTCVLKRRAVNMPQNDYQKHPINKDEGNNHDDEWSRLRDGVFRDGNEFDRLHPVMVKGAKSCSSSNMIPNISLITLANLVLVSSLRNIQI